MYSEEDYLELSGIQHFSFCRRQWALIHIEKSWDENYNTVEGQLQHERVHDYSIKESRRDVFFVRDMLIHSSVLGIAGKCDMVEFLSDREGIELHGRKGRWLPRAVEYKHGESKTTDCDRLQLTAQIICLEEMLCCPTLREGYLFYFRTRRREQVKISDDLRNQTKAMFQEMHEYYKKGFTPLVKPKKSCKNCSINTICLPKLLKKKSVKKYISSTLKGF